MTLSKQEDKLIVCWASFTLIGGGNTNDAPCVVYNSIDLLQTLQTVPGSCMQHHDVYMHTIFARIDAAPRLVAALKLMPHLNEEQSKIVAALE